MVQRDQVPEEVTDKEKWIQDKYTLESASYTDLITGIEHLKTRGYAVQPDGDLVGDRADGEVFHYDQSLAADETLTTDWYDTDGFRSIELTIISDVPSPPDGVRLEYTEDAQATTPEVSAFEEKTFRKPEAEDGFRIFDYDTRLDGFRIKYTNGGSPVSNFHLIGTLRDEESLSAPGYVSQTAFGKDIVRVGNEPIGPGLKIGSPSSLFDDIETIERRSVLDISSTFGTSILRDDPEFTGSGSIVENPADSGEILIGTGTTAGSSATLRSAQFGRYVPGYSAQAGIGVRLPQTLPTNGEIKWGYFNEQNGFYFGYDGDQGELFVARLSDGAESERIYRSNWNGADIEETLGRTWSPSQGDIWQIDFSWYGYGIIVFSLVTQTQDTVAPITPQQETIRLHAISVTDETSTADPNEPVTIEVDNEGTTEDVQVYLGGRQFSVYGRSPAEKRITAQNRTGVSVDETAWTYIMSWRRDPNSVTNSKLNLNTFDTLQTGNTKYAILVDANISGTNYVTPQLVNANETLLQVSTTGTFNGIGNGTKVYETLAAGGGGNKVEGAATDVDVGFGQNKEITLVARGATASSTVTATMRMREDW